MKFNSGLRKKRHFIAAPVWAIAAYVWLQPRSWRACQRPFPENTGYFVSPPFTLFSLHFLFYFTQSILTIFKQSCSSYRLSSTCLETRDRCSRRFRTIEAVCEPQCPTPSGHSIAMTFSYPSSWLEYFQLGPSIFTFYH